MTRIVCGSWRMAKMRVVQVPHPKGPLELVERAIPEPGTGAVRIKVQACGICHSDTGPSDVVAVLGLGGLGHLGVQFAAKLGFNTVAIARGKDKEALARRLGAHHYIDSAADDAATALVRLGGAKVILATATSGE